MLARAGLDLVPRTGVVEALRAVKDETELELLRRIAKVTDRVFERLLDVPFVGRREIEVAWDLAGLFHDEGGAGPAYELIVGSGPTGSHPHGRAGEREIEAGELVVIDAGCTIDGYSSDYTRTFATGPVDAEMKEAYAVVLSAQEAALAAMRAGVPAVEVDATARRIIDDSPFRGRFGHGLGHGLGLEIHEAPRMSPETSDVLEAGNVITVEPGVYVEGKFGDPHRGRRRRHRRRDREPHRLPEGPARSRLTARYHAPPWPRWSTRTSSRTACTSSSTGSRGASSSSST